MTLTLKLRANAQNDFEKDFFKLMNNSVFGKTMENIRNRVDIKLVTNESQARKRISKPSFDRRKIFCDDLAAIHMHRTKLLFNKPVYLGMSILDISKTLMYDFHYDYNKEKYNDKARLPFTDTDSLMHEIETDDFYKDISGNVLTSFDTSNYPKDHPSGNTTGVNKKVIGMLKDEVGGRQTSEFVGLRTKLYSYVLDSSNEQEKKFRGVKKAVVNKDINFQDYEDCRINGGKKMRVMNLIRSRDHDIYTEEVNKIALSREDDERNILPNRIDNLALRHYRIKDI